MRSGCRRIVNGILWEMSELITQERIAVGSWNLVDGLTTWPAMYDHWPRSKVQGHKVTKRISSNNAMTRQRMVISASKLGGNCHHEVRITWHTF